MKKTVISFACILMAITTMAQIQDSIAVQRKNDTIRIGGMIILKKGNPDEKKHVTVTVGSKHYEKQTNLSTASFIVDLGFANWVDKTNYGTATANNYLINRPGSPALAESDFKLRTIKSVNVNIWFFMQRLNLIKHYVNLKYGLGLELNNYRFTSNITFKEGGFNPYNASQDVSHPFVFEDSITFRKNKLAADYITIPLMLNFRTNPNNSDKGVSLSAGVSVGYLYGSRNKQISDEFGKHKNRGVYDLQRWKYSYVAELGLGLAHLYGSYTPKSIFENGLNFMPYTVGIRLSNW